MLTTIGLALIAVGDIDLGSNYSVSELVGLWLATVAVLGATYALAGDDAQGSLRSLPETGTQG